MNKETIFNITSEWSKNAIVDKDQYAKMYKESIDDNEGFWREQGKCLEWIKPFSKIKNVNYSSSNVDIKWFYDGTLNASFNCIDRHAKNNPNKIAIISEEQQYTYDKIDQMSSSVSQSLSNFPKNSAVRHCRKISNCCI